MDSRSSAQKAEAARPALVASISHFGRVSGPQRCPWVCGLSGSPVGSFRAVDCQTDDWFEALCRRGLELSLGHRPLNVGADTGFQEPWPGGWVSAALMFCCPSVDVNVTASCGTAVGLPVGSPGCGLLHCHSSPSTGSQCLVGSGLGALQPPTLLVLSGSLVWGAQGAPACRVT